MGMIVTSTVTPPTPHRSGLRAFFRIIQLIVWLVLGIITIAVLAAFVPWLFDHKSYIVYSGSMEPEIGTGSVVVGQAVSPAKLKPGDVITFRAPTGEQTLITHRITGVAEKNGLAGFRTKGDANRTEDAEVVTWNLVVIKVVYSVPFVGYLLDYVQKTDGKLVIIGVAVALMLLQPLERKLIGERAARPVPEPVVAASQPLPIAVPARLNRAAEGVEPVIPVSPAPVVSISPEPAGSLPPSGSAAALQPSPATHQSTAQPAAPAPPADPVAVFAAGEPPEPTRTTADLEPAHAGTNGTQPVAQATGPTPNAQALVILAHNATKSGNREQAFDYFTQAVELDPANEEAWLGMATSAPTLEDALTCLNAVLLLNPSNEFARRGLVAAQRAHEQARSA